MSKHIISILLIFLGLAFVLTECSAQEGTNEFDSTTAKQNTEAGPKFIEVQVVLDKEEDVPLQRVSNDVVGGISSWFKEKINQIVGADAEKAGDSKSQDNKQDRHYKSELGKKDKAIVNASEQHEKNIVSPSKLPAYIAKPLDEDQWALDEEKDVPSQRVNNDRDSGFGSWLKNVYRRVVGADTEKAGDSKSQDAKQDRYSNTESEWKKESKTVVDASERPEKNIVSSIKPPVLTAKPLGISNYMNELEAELQQQLGNNGISVIRDGNNLILDIPNKVLFKPKRYILESSARMILKSLVDVIAKYNGVSVEIAGHTDNQGPGIQNHRLSQQRADGIATFFRNTGVEESRIFAVGHGERMPIASNMDKEGRSQNQRMEISLYPQL